MKISTIIIGVILAIVAGMVIYAWGLGRQRRQTRDLLNLLFSKGESRVRKYLKKHDSVTLQQVQEMMKGMTARFPFSSDKAAVKDPMDFSRKLMEHMTRTGELTGDGKIYRRTR